jgi:membrane protein YqaA with SNARE-associated domain
MLLALGTFFYMIGSALLPFLNAELYLIGIGSRVPHVEYAIIAAAGQTVGKVIWYYAGIHAMKIPWLARKMQTESWQASYAKWHGRIVGRPVMAGLICFVSAVTGFPPLAIVAVLAGSLEMNLVVFFVTTLVGRAIRFYIALATGSGLWDLSHHLFGWIHT